MQGRIFQLQAEFQTGLSFNSQYTSKGINCKIELRLNVSRRRTSNRTDHSEGTQLQSKEWDLIRR